MRKEIKLLRNNEERDWTDLEWISEFYEFLKGNSPDKINDGKPVVSLSSKDAFSIIWYLQEHLSVLPDNIEKCDNCDEIYDSYSSGYYSEKGNDIGHFFCNACEHLAPHDDEL